jgi:hypothetical protein
MFPARFIPVAYASLAVTYSSQKGHACLCLDSPGDDEIARVLAYCADDLERRIVNLFQAWRSGYAKRKDS